MNTYEGLFIFGQSVQDDRVKDMGVYVRTEIEKLGGTVVQSRDIGRRMFARTMQKTESGVYLAVVFKMEPDKIAPLNARYKMNDELFRCQIVRLDEKFANTVPSTAALEPRGDRDRGDRGDRDRGDRGDRDRGDRGSRDRSYA